MKDSGSHLNLSSSSSNIINWNNIIKKEARSITNNIYIGSIQGLYEPFIVVEKQGALNQKRYFIPKDLLKEYDDIAVYFRTEGISTIIITEKRDQEEEALRKNNSTNVIVFDKTSLPLKKAKETAIDLKGVLHTVGKVVAVAVAERIISLLNNAMKFTNSFGLTSTLKAKQSMTSKEELKAIHKRLLKKLGVNKQCYYGELLTIFRINLSNLLKNYSVQGNLAHLYNFLAIKHLISLFHLYVKSKLTNRS
jgi:hypothetical protein